MPPSRRRPSEGAAEHYIIRRPGGGGGHWDPRETPYMVEPLDMWASRRHAAFVFVGPAQSGKALDVDTPIPTPTGWATMGELTRGDVVFDENGAPTEVVLATEVQYGRRCFRVTFSDGSEIVADADHQWSVERFYWKAPLHRSEVRTTRQMAEDYVLSERTPGRRRYRYRVRTAAPVQTPEAAVPIDPYLLGVWLGDGSTRNATISTHVRDAEHYIVRFQRAGHTVHIRGDSDNTIALQIDRRGRLTTHCQRGHVLAEVGRTSQGYCGQCDRNKYWRKRTGKGQFGEDLTRPPSLFAGTFLSRLRALGVWGDKHLPREYLRASEGQRWALLQGLMDTDGSCSAKAACAEFVTTLPRLARDFVELAASLGLKPTKKEKRTSWTYRGECKFGSAFRITFPLPPGAPVFSLPRKVATAKTTTTDVGYRQIVDITPAPTRPVKCIQVASPKHTYLVGPTFIVTHNTAALGEAFLAHAVFHDPGDMILVQMTREKAREYSRQRIDRMIRANPALKRMLLRATDDNTFDKLFTNGMWVRLAWPTVPNLSSSSYRYAFGTDYDRWEDDIGGEGDGFTLLGKRTTTFLSRGMHGVESSPGRDVTDLNYQLTGAHEGPPVGGVVGIYNRSDRRRWYWPCARCGGWFEAAPGMGLFRLPPFEQLVEDIRTINIDRFARDFARVYCPHCDAAIAFAEREALNAAGRWRVEGFGTSDQRTSSILGYWLGGVAASYVTWETLVRKYMQGVEAYASSGDELPLKTTTNTDQGMPYTPLRLVLNASKARTTPAGRAEEIERFIVPSWARFVIAKVDVQGGANARFIVQIHAVGEFLEQQVIDRYAITESLREDVDGRRAPIDPARYAEDWDVLTQRVVRSTYRIEGRDDQELRVYRTGVDSGGEAGATANAYRWLRRLRTIGEAHRVRLLKGEGRKVDWFVRETFVSDKDGAKDIPLLLLETNKIKDAVQAALDRETPGPGYYHWPRPRSSKYPHGWVTQSFFDELGAETRGPDGKWVKVKARNETWDLCVYGRALLIHMGCERREFWKDPPAWALPLDQANSELMIPEARREMKEHAPTAPVTYARSVRRSAYMR